MRAQGGSMVVCGDTLSNRNKSTYMAAYWAPSYRRLPNKRLKLTESPTVQSWLVRGDEENVTHLYINS